MPSHIAVLESWNLATTQAFLKHRSRAISECLSSHRTLGSEEFIIPQVPEEYRCHGQLKCSEMLGIFKSEFLTPLNSLQTMNPSNFRMHRQYIELPRDKNSIVPQVSSGTSRSRVTPIVSRFEGIMEVERLESTESSGTLKQARVISNDPRWFEQCKVKCLIIFQATRHIHPPSIRNKPLPQVSFTCPLTTLSTPFPSPPSPPKTDRVKSRFHKPRYLRERKSE